MNPLVELTDDLEDHYSQAIGQRRPFYKIPVTDI